MAVLTSLLDTGSEAYVSNRKTQLIPILMTTGLQGAQHEGDA